MVDILIGQVHPAGKACSAVNDQDLAVIPVVVVGRYERLDFGKRLAADTKFLQFFRILRVQGGNLAHAVIHDPHVYPGFGFVRQDLQDTAPHQAFINDEVFQPDELLRLLQLGQHRFILLFPAAEELYLGMLIDREASAAAQIPAQIIRSGINQFLSGKCFRILGQAGLRRGNHLLHPLPQHPVTDIALSEPQENRGRHRHQHDHEHPGQFGAVIHRAVNQIEHHD